MLVPPLVAWASPAGSVVPPSPVNTTPPVISGAAQDGQTLTSTAGSWSSPDPLAYRYQWQRCDSSGAGCANITGATTTSYKLSWADVGHQITVVVSATDKEHQTTRATATSVGPVAAPPPPANTTAPVISGEAQDGQALTVSRGSWSSPDPLAVRYRWQRCDSSGANCGNLGGSSSSYKLGWADVGHQITVAVSATDKENQTAQATVAAVGPVAAPPAPANTTAPMISGADQDGQTLKSTIGSWSSPDPLAFGYQWRRCDSSGAGCTNIIGATSSSYIPTSTDVNDEITVVVSATDKESQATQATASPVGPVVAPPQPANTKLPVISGWAQDGQTLFVANGSWSSPDVLSFGYQWQRCDSSGASCTDITGGNSQTYVLANGDDGSQITVVVSAIDAEHQVTKATATAVGPVTSGPLAGIHKIQHVVIVMQENRSFDSYFGTYPGADGIPGLAGNPGTLPCVPDPLEGGCVRPYHDSDMSNLGGPHGATDMTADVDGGNMDGFVRRAELGMKCGSANPSCSPCTQAVQTSCIGVMGYHNASEIPNYWTYAEHFVLQDHMFESAAAASPSEHQYMVSEWSASCKNAYDPMSCSSSLSGFNPPRNPTPLLAWTDLTNLLYDHTVSWDYYVFPGTQPDCEDPSATTCPPVQQSPQTPGIWNPLPYFTDVHQDNQLSNIQSIGSFYTAARLGDLPAVSWVVPSWQVSDHPAAWLGMGQAYVTGVINAVMESPDWDSTAIFLSWDDWGGFYDHLDPPVVDGSGYGLRVPGLVISPYAKQGYIDHQILSHDSYVKFIEDDFLGGERLDPAVDGRPDPRPGVRETNPVLGDLTADFDFNQSPAPPMILPQYYPPVNTAPPTISGTAQDGQTLTTGTGSWSSTDPLLYTYQWQRCDNSGANCTNITNANFQTYTLTSADVGDQVTVVVSATDREHQTKQTTATPVGPVTA
jgi:phospholipase C